MRIDAHLHFWKISRGDYGWMGPHVAPLCRDYLPEHVRDELGAQGFTAGIAVQAAPTVAETEYLLGLAAESPLLAGVVGWVDLESESLQRTLSRLRANPKFVGVRPMLQDLDDDAWIVRPRVLDGLAQIADAGLAFDFLVYPRHLRYVCQALDRVPRLRAVIDHAAKPNLRTRVLDAWRAALREVAARPTVFCKVSGLVTEADPLNFTAGDLALAIDPVFEMFGEDRVMFGSDWPVCTLAASYDRVVAAVREVFGSRLSAARSAKLFGQNAATFYRLPEVR